MLGDLAESILRRIGVTKAFFNRVTGGCGCGKRQDWLNTWGLKVQRKTYHSRAWWRPIAVAAFRWAGRLNASLNARKSAPESA